jgi:hypothetical protein
VQNVSRIVDTDLYGQFLTPERRALLLDAVKAVAEREQSDEQRA